MTMHAVLTPQGRRDVVEPHSLIRPFSLTALMVTAALGLMPALAAAQGPGGAASAGPSPALNPTPVPAAVMAHTCAACHGTNGQLGDEAFKPLAGMPVQQFVRTMIDFREGRRPSTLMGHVARGFTNADLEAMAEFFAAIPPLTGAGTPSAGGQR